MPSREERFWNNLEKKIYLGVGPYNIPEIKPEKYIDCKYVRFNEAQKCRNCKGLGVHFFVDDYYFDKVWNQFGRYIKMLAKFDAVLTPDWSVYTDWPVAVNIWNHYRKHYVGAYLQDMGVKVFPTIEWSDKESHKWCFDGEPVGSCVAIGSIGTQRDVEARKLFVYGYDAMLERLQPETIMFWGKLPRECRGNVIKMDERYRWSREAGDQELMLDVGD